MSLGIINANPGNIRHNPTIKWQGEAAVDPHGFVVFDTPLNGIRALAIDLKNKIKRGLDTIEKILNVYAPPSENDTIAYIGAVCESTGLNADERLTIASDTITKLVKAIIRHENGEQPYSEGIVAEAVTLALT